MPTINLAPGTQYIVAARERRKRMILLSLVILGITGAIWGGLFWYRQRLANQENEISARIRTINMEITRLEESAQRVVLFEDRLEALGALLDQHISVDPLLLAVEQLLPPQVVLRDFNADIDHGVLLVTGRTENIDQIAQVVASLKAGQNTIFQDAKLTTVQREVQRDEEGLEVGQSYLFDAEFTFDTNVLRQQS